MQGRHGERHGNQQFGDFRLVKTQWLEFKYCGQREKWPQHQWWCSNAYLVEPQGQLPVQGPGQWIEQPVSDQTQRNAEADEILEQGLVRSGQQVVQVGFALGFRAFRNSGVEKPNILWPHEISSRTT